MDLKKILFKTNAIDVEHALPNAIIFASKDGKIQWVNDIAADIFETSKMHLMTSNISDFFEAALSIVSNAVLSNKQVIIKLNDRVEELEKRILNIEYRVEDISPNDDLPDNFVSRFS